MVACSSLATVASRRCFCVLLPSVTGPNATRRHLESNRSQSIDGEPVGVHNHRSVTSGRGPGVDQGGTMTTRPLSAPAPRRRTRALRGVIAAGMACGLLAASASTATASTLPVPYGYAGFVAAGAEFLANPGGPPPGANDWS